jgi:hypothetical protein
MKENEKMELDKIQATGKKTYATAIVSALTAVGLWYTGSIDLGTAITMVAAAAQAVFLRRGLAVEVQKATSQLPWLNPSQPK